MDSALEKSVRAGVRILVHDIDGCLNPPDGEDFGPGNSGGLSLNQLEYLGRLKASLETTGVELVLNTGRNLEDSEAMVEALHGPQCRYGLFEHGAYGWDFERNEEVDLHRLALAQGDAERAKKYKSMAVIPRLIEWYQNDGRHRLSQILGVEPPPLRKRSNLSLECIEGLQAPVLMKTLREVIEEHFPAKTEEPLVYCHSTYFVDVLGTVHKSDGAHILMKHLEIGLDEVLVVGDGMNDMDMFNHWPKLLCPSNAFGDLQQLCLKRGGRVSGFSHIEATLDFLKKSTP